MDLWPEYLELLTVADEQRYESGADDASRAARSIQGIQVVELYSADTAATGRHLGELGYQLPRVREDRLATTGSSDGADLYLLALTVVVDDPPAAAAAWDVVIAPSVHSL